jgi:hypothetical protein
MTCSGTHTLRPRSLHDFHLPQLQYLNGDVHESKSEGVVRELGLERRRGIPKPGDLGKKTVCTHCKHISALTHCKHTKEEDGSVLIHRLRHTEQRHGPVPIHCTTQRAGKLSIICYRQNTESLRTMRGVCIDRQVPHPWASSNTKVVQTAGKQESTWSGYTQPHPCNSRHPSSLESRKYNTALA